MIMSLARIFVTALFLLGPILPSFSNNLETSLQDKFVILDATGKKVDAKIKLIEHIDEINQSRAEPLSSFSLKEVISE